MNERYLSGIKREVVIWHKRGRSISEISQAFRVSRAFILDALATVGPLDIAREWAPNFDDINDTGGY